MVGIKVLDENGKGSMVDVLAGIEWMLENRKKYGIRVANLSIGVDAGENDPLVKAVETAWDAGVVMCVAAGNNGPQASSITSPGVSRKAITVGSCDDDLESDNSSLRLNFSGRGPTFDCVVKPDCLAPGCSIVSCLSNSPELCDERRASFRKVGEHYVRMSGTSMSSPHVAGAIALLLQKEPHLTPDEVKLRLKQSCRKINEPQNRQGWGLFDINKFLSED